jgi:type I restriction enzyme S subunit
MLRDGDVLFVRTNGNPDYVGRSAVFNRTALDQAGFDGSKCVYASYLIRARLNAELCPHFLQAYLTTAEGRKFLRERSKTSAGQYNVNIDGLSSLPVYVPPVELQNQFREKLDALRSTGSLAGKASAAAQLIAASLSAQLCSP